MTADAITIARERPDQHDVMRLIAAIDALMTSLYPAESNHLLDVAALSDPAVTFLVVRDRGEAGRLRRNPARSARLG